MAGERNAAIAAALGDETFGIRPLGRRAGDQHQYVVVRGQHAANQLGKALRHPAPLRQHLAGVRIDQHQTHPARVEIRRELLDPRQQFRARRGAGVGKAMVSCSSPMNVFV